MTDAAREARNAYQREYYKKYYLTHPEAREKKNAYRKKWGEKPENKEKIKGYVKKYWERKAQAM